MSQYPPNPQYPQYPQYPYPGQPMYGMPDPQADLLRPARRASILMFVLAGLMLLCGVCFGASSFVPLDRLEGEQRAEFERLEAEMGQPFATMMAVAAGFTLIPGVLLLIMAILVRRGGMTVAIVSMVISLLLALLLLVAIADSVIAATREPAAIMGVCMVAVPLALIGLLVVWLFQAIRNAPRLADLRLGQQTAYWQSDQQRQQYGGGYWQQQQPPPPPPPPG